MKARIFMLFVRDTISGGKSAVYLRYCNGGESLFHKHSFHTLPSAAVKECLDLLNLPGKRNDLTSYASVLKFFGSHKALDEGKCTHHLIISLGLDLNMFILSHLVQMYGTCAAFDDAFSLFGKMHERSVFSWNFIIRSCARHGENEKVLILLEQMQCEGIIPTKVTYVSIFVACASLAPLNTGLRRHALILSSPFVADVVVGTALVNMYGNFGNIEGAWLCFDKMQQRDVIAWTVLIATLSQHAHQGQQALHSFEQMLQEATLPNEVTFISLCDACANHVMLSDGKRMHALVSCVDLEANFVLGNALINMYGKCGSSKLAEAIFNMMSHRTLVSWTAIILAYSQRGYCQEAVQHFFHMQQLGILPDNVSFTTILSVCASSVLLSMCKHMHVIILIKEPEMDVIIGTALVYTYGKCQDLVSARSTFDLMTDRNLYTWNAAIAVFTQNGHDQEAAILFDQMQEEGILPNKVTFVSVFEACGNSQSPIKCGVQLHACILQGGVEVQTAIINMYGRWGRLDVAQSMFDNISERKSITWNVLISAYVQHGEMNKALGYFVRMCWEGSQPDEATFVSVLSTCDCEEASVNGQLLHAYIVEGKFECDVVVGTALISMYGRCGSVENARSVFYQMEKRSEVSWNAMIAVHEQAEQSKEALELFEHMQHDNVSPDYVTFLAIVSACIAQFASVEGRMVHALILENGCIADVVLATAILNMYGKSGSVEDAHRVFDQMQQRNVVSWNTMIAVYAQHGLAMGALSLFSQMQADGIQPNDITLVNILGACSHCGYLYEACHQFKLILDLYLFPPTVDNCVCLVDLFGRAGCLDEAQDILNDMPLLPSAVSFIALLGACRYRDDLERGLLAAKHASEMEPNNRAPWLVLSNLYAAVGRVDDAVLAMSLFEDHMKETDFVDEVELHNIYDEMYLLVQTS